MSKRKAFAKELIKVVIYDAQRMLDDEKSSKEIYHMISKRLSRLKDNSWQKVVWD